MLLRRRYYRVLNKSQLRFPHLEHCGRRYPLPIILCTVPAEILCIPIQTIILSFHGYVVMHAIYLRLELDGEVSCQRQGKLYLHYARQMGMWPITIRTRN